MNVLFYKNILMLEYGNVYFNWLEDIRKYKYFLQSSLLKVSNRNLFSYHTLKLAPTFCLRVHSDLDTWVWLTSRGDIKNIALLCLCIMEQFELFPTLTLEFPFLFSLFSKHNWKELCFSNSFRFESLNSLYARSRYIFWVGILLTRWLPTTSILVVIWIIYHYQFKCNYLKN